VTARRTIETYLEKGGSAPELRVGDGADAHIKPARRFMRLASDNTALNAGS
jgi:hypothetical protein